MKEFIEKLIGRLKEEKSKDVCDSISCIECHQRYKNDSSDTCYKPIQMLAYDNAISIVNQLAEEYNDGWITDRNPTKEECGEYGHAKFQVTIPQSKGNKTITMDFVYETVRCKEVARWKWCDRLPVWEVLAWKPLDAPYQPGE